MAGAHHDAVHVGGGGVLGVVFVEGVVPHGGPQVVALAPQEQFEDVGVELVAVVGDAARGRGPLGRVAVLGDVAVLGADVVGEGGASSLKKMPRYLTEGSPTENLPALTYSSACFLAGTSAQ